MELTSNQLFALINIVNNTFHQIIIYYGLNVTYNRVVSHPQTELDLMSLRVAQFRLAKTLTLCMISL